MRVYQSCLLMRTVKRHLIYLRRDGAINAAELFESRVAIISACWKDGDHQLEVRSYLLPDGIQVCVCTVIRNF